MEKIRLSKIMSGRGICSRREADEYIARGLVFVDGERVGELGTKVSPDCEITLDKRAEAESHARVTIILNKPVGYVSSQPEKGYKAAVTLISPQTMHGDNRAARRFSPAHLRNLAPAGRLDIDSQGLLVLTQDGRVAKQLIGEDSGVEKEYVVRVEGAVSEEALTLLTHGLSLDGEPLKPAKVTDEGKGALRFVLTQGKKRQIRRMCELAGLKVTSLKRVRIGKITLGDLPVGKWRYLRDDEGF
ncbi:MAG TPA: pseudouridine synthase [Nitrospirota bacterium]|nr:pseudouridine synthase [Nitrospirota bacterium]